MGTPPPDALLCLVDRFDQDRKVFLSGDYEGEQLSVAKTPHEQESIQRQIAATDRQIDNLVYEPYGLTEEEIRTAGGGEKCRTERCGRGPDLREELPEALESRGDR
jgi:hypothetical protein